MMDGLLKLQQWYAAQCNGIWEHGNGVKIETIDNPGWAVTITLKGSTLENVPLQAVKREGEQDWINCRVREGVFEGFGGAGNLDELLEIFGTWMEHASSEASGNR